MSKTIVDMAKVTQMLDSGWEVRIYRGGMGGYEVRAVHRNETTMNKTRAALIKEMAKCRDFLKGIRSTAAAAVEEMSFDDGWLMTDDFTPEQALTRMAYKVHGEII